MHFICSIDSKSFTDPLLIRGKQFEHLCFTRLITLDARHYIYIQCTCNYGLFRLILLVEFSVMQAV